MRPIRYGIIGVTNAAQYHADAMYRVADSELVAICSSPDDDPVADSFGVPLVDSYSDLLANPLIDAISICSPCDQHAVDALAAAQAGKHVLVEPPLALNLADADALIDACQRTGVILSVALQRRTEPQFQAIHAAIAQGELGRLVHSNVLIPFSRQQGAFTSALAHVFCSTRGFT